MGKATGFLEYERKENIRISAKERIRTFEEFYAPLGASPAAFVCAPAHGATVFW